MAHGIKRSICLITVLLGAASQRIEYLALEFIGTPWLLDILDDWRKHERGSIPGPTECCIMIFIISVYITLLHITIEKKICQNSICVISLSHESHICHHFRLNLGWNNKFVLKRNSWLCEWLVEYHRFYIEHILCDMDWVAHHELVCCACKFQWWFSALYSNLHCFKSFNGRD